MSEILTCIAIDDEPPALKIIEIFAQKTPELKLLRVFDDAVTAGEYLRNNDTNLIFTDIDMPDISGLDLVRSLPKKPLIIFTTAHKKFAFEGFELEAVDYLLKPFGFDRFTKAVTKALEQSRVKNAEEPSYITVKTGYKLQKINTGTIDYVEGLEDYVRINLTDSKPVLTLMTMKAISEKLPANFVRIHRSFIVNFSAVDNYLNRQVTLKSGVQLSVSDTYNAGLKQLLHIR